MVKKDIMSECVAKTMKHIVQVSNANIVRNADCFLSRREKDEPADWIAKSEICVPSEKCMTSY